MNFITEITLLDMCCWLFRGHWPNYGYWE